MASRMKYTNAKIHKAKAQHNPFKFEIDKGMEFALHIAIDEFVSDPKATKYEFPSSLTSVQRGYVHQYVQNIRLNSKSYGRGK